MPFTLKDDEEEARERLRAFWSGSSLGRPALHILAKNPSYIPSPAPDDMLEGKDTDFSPEWHAWRADEYLKQWIFLAEAMPGTIFWWGTGLTMLAVLCGADYDYHTESAWIRPMPDVYDHPLPSFDPDDGAVRALDACYVQIAEVVGQRGYLNPPPLMDGFTTLSSLRGPSTLCLDLIESPAVVRRWCDALTTLYLACYDHFYRLLNQLGYGDTSAWLHAMAEGRMDAVQCDMAVLLSPHMYAEYVMSDNRRVTKYLDYSLYHLDGTEQLRFLDQIATLPGLNGIQWNPETTAGPPSRWIDAFRQIRDLGLSLHIECPSVDEAITLTRALGPAGLMLVLPPFDSQHEARQALQAIQAAC